MYDFDAQPGTGELSINAGEILTVLRTDVGEGWWEGLNSKGESGLFPEAYVEVKRTIYSLFIVNYAQNALLHHHFYLHKCICIMASLAEHFLQGRCHNSQMVVLF